MTQLSSGAKAGLALNVFGNVFGGVGSILTGFQNNDISQYNADIARQQAQRALDRGKTDEQQYRLSIAQLIGKQRAQLAAKGFDLGADTALQIQLDTARIGEIDALTIRNNAALEAWGYRAQAINLENQGRAAQIGGVISGLTGIAQGGFNTFLAHDALKG